MKEEQRQEPEEYERGIGRHSEAESGEQRHHLKQHGRGEPDAPVVESCSKQIHDAAGQQGKHGGHETHTQDSIAEQGRADMDQDGYPRGLRVVAPIELPRPIPVLGLVAAEVGEPRSHIHQTQGGEDQEE